MPRSIRLALLIGLVAVLPAAPVQAAPIIFTGALAPTLASFQLLTGAVNVVGGNLPNIGRVTDGVLDGVGGNDNGVYSGIADLSFLLPSTDIYSGTSGTGISDWSTLLAGPDIALSAQERLVITMPYLVYSMGFEYHEPTSTSAPPNGTNSGTAFDSVYTVTLYNGLNPVYSFQFNGTDNTAYFVGVAGNLAFNRMDINETSGGIDNEYFNRVYAGTNPIPEPASLFLLGVGLVGAAGLARHRRRR